MTSNTPVLSIIMPVKNLDRYLTDCLSSIIDQSFKDWELLIVNDHSIDQTEKILADFQSKDSRIHIYQNQGTGIIPALKLALDKARSAYVSRFDGDDIMPEGRLEAMVNALDKAPPKTIITGKVKYFGSEPISPGYQKYEDWLNQRIDQKDHWNWVYRECVIASPNWMLRRQELVNIDAFDIMTYPEDYDLLLQWYKHDFQIKCLDIVTLHWREHLERTSRNSHHYNQEHFFQLKVKHFIAHELMDDKLALWGTDVKGKLTAQILDQLDAPFQWMGLEPKVHELNGQKVLPYTTIASMSNVKLLLAVYPSQKQKQELENYLNGLGFQLGLNYWYL